MDLIVVVDGGGSHCRLGVYDSTGARLTTTLVRSAAQLSLGASQSWVSVRTGLEQLASELGLPRDWQPASLCLGLAGALQLEPRAKFISLLPKKTHFKLFTDGYAQLIGATGNSPGICLSVGTGSVLHWMDDDRNTGMAGGWGFPAADEGAGAWLGLQLLSRFCKYNDQQAAAQGARVELSKDSNETLFARLEREITGSALPLSDSLLQQWTTLKDPTRLASLAPLVCAAAEHDDLDASKLLDDGFQHLAELLECAPQHLGIYLVGGLASAYQERLQGMAGERCVAAKGDALDGLYQLYHSDDNGLTV